MATVLEIPEVASLDAGQGIVRIPPELDVPLTPRLRRLIDTPQFRRLARISQLGFVSLVYPAAIHTRFEHSLGVFRLALLFLKHLGHDRRFCEVVGPRDGELFLAAALLHDIGHWPFCHPIEDIRLPDVPSHEQFARRFLLEGDVADVLRGDWQIEPAQVVSLLDEPQQTPAGRLLGSMLSGPIDIDKMDYLFRDSLHAGVPYGRNFDQPRLISSLCLNGRGDGLAITEKGKTAAELLVFARYVMFSEVYWHHGVRAATAMLQRGFYLLRESLDLESLFQSVDAPMIAALQTAAAGTPAEELFSGLFGPVRRLYKRLTQYSYFEHREVYERLARRPYPWLAACSAHFATVLGDRLGTQALPHEVLFDSPPVQREMQIDVDIYYLKEDRYRPLAEVSPVVRTLAREQFDDYVKRVRLFVHPRIAAAAKGISSLADLVLQAVQRTDAHPGGIP